MGGQEKEWMECFLDDLRAFGINADHQWTTAVQDEGEWRRSAEQRGGTFHGEVDRCRESQGWTTACSRMPERAGKRQGEDSLKQAGSCWFARHSAGSLAIVLVRSPYLNPPGVWFADVITFFSSVVCFVLFHFRIFAFTKTAAVRSIVLRSACAPTVTRSYLKTVLKTVCVLFFLFSFFFLWRFSEHFFTIIVVFSLYGGYAVRLFPFSNGVFRPCARVLDFLHHIV